jgi:MoxR-like ATPase
MKFETKHFAPLSAGGIKLDEEGTVAYQLGPGPEDTYVYTPRTIFALNIAIATNRPLLISGEPGSGKSTLAKNAAAVLRRWYYKETITSRTRASDLLWTFDALRRLSDAITPDPDQPLLDKRCYVDPGTLWWAFDPASAHQRGTEGEIPEEQRPREKGEQTGSGGDGRAVVLFDEIDKADPDVPNDLLEPFDVKSFTVRETNDTVTARREVLLILTTNGERELPPAFLRRCVTFTMSTPDKAWFVRIANQRYGEKGESLHTAVAEKVMKLRQAAARAGLREPSTGEYLDALQVCRELDINPDSQAWGNIAESVLWKHAGVPQATANLDR